LLLFHETAYGPIVNLFPTPEDGLFVVMYEANVSGHYLRSYWRLGIDIRLDRMRISKPWSFPPRTIRKTLLHMGVQANMLGAMSERVKACKGVGF
jgi:hypothetical protein